MSEAADGSKQALPRILVVDLETTGLDPARHSIVEIGAVWLTGPPRSWEAGCRMWDGAEWDPAAAKVNGLDEERCRSLDHKSEACAVVEFLRWAAASPHSDTVMLAGLNPTFDRGFLLAASQRAGMDCSRLFRHRVIDLHTLAVAYALKEGLDVPSRGLYTDEIYAVLGLEAEPQPHRALVGAEKEAEALGFLMGLPK